MLLYITYLFCSPILWIIVIIGSIFNTKIRANYLSFWSQLKHIQSCLKNNKKEIYLFHAASAGEFEQLQPILRLINRNKYYVIVTFTSSTIFSQQKDSKLADHICYHPFDLFWQSYLFFKIINPTKYIITRHDIWPNHIMIASYLQIKVYFINANIHCNSIWNNRYLSTLPNLLFSKFEYILVPSKQIFNKIKNNKIKNLKINIYPDSRIDQILYKYHHNQLSMPQRIDKKLTTIFASIDQFDEEVIFNALEKKYTNGSIDLEKKQEYLIFVPQSESRFVTLDSIDLICCISAFNTTSCLFLFFDPLGRPLPRLGLLLSTFLFSSVFFGCICSIKIGHDFLDLVSISIIT